jgi:hypothetical protein
MTATSQRITYNAYGNRSGLTDVKINIYNASNTKVVDQAVMTELGSTGIYYYDYTPVSSSWHIYQANTESEPKYVTGTFNSDYSSVTSVSTTSSDYCSVYELAEFMGISGNVPDLSGTGDSRSPETVGTGDGSTATFYLDHGYVLDGSYTLTYGTSGTAFTKTTHYTISLDKGKISITATGLTVLSTNILYAEYCYNTLNIRDAEMQGAIDRATADILKDTNGAYFVNGSADTPSWKVATNEEQDGGGMFRRSYYIFHRPLASVVATLDGDHLADATTLTVDSTAGFPSSGVINIGADKITYTGKTDTTFTGCTGVDSAHSDGDDVNSFCIEISTTSQGTAPTWQVMTKDEDYNIDLSTGRVYLYTETYQRTVGSLYNEDVPPKNIPGRFRASYLWGYNTIPEDIKLVTMMKASQDIMHKAVRKSSAQGRDSFSPELINVDQDLIEKIMSGYRQIYSGRT